jgi:hypothetical protein
MNHVLEKIDVQFHADWDIVRSTYNKLYTLKSAGQFDSNKHKISDDRFDYYRLKHFGEILDYGSGDTPLSPGWCLWHGKHLESMLPWSGQFRQLFNKFEIGHMSWSSHDSSVARHRDLKVSNESHLPHCSLNYIIRCDDPSAITNAYNDDLTLNSSYLSIPNTAWLLNIDMLHDVVNNGRREVFQIKFYNEFEHVLEFFEKNGPMVFS